VDNHYWLNVIFSLVEQVADRLPGEAPGPTR
jgi:hypothetical protein